MTFQEKIQPVAIAAMVVGAPAMPEWVVALTALFFVGLSGWLFWDDRKSTNGGAA